MKNWEKESEIKKLEIQSLYLSPSLLKIQAVFRAYININYPLSLSLSLSL
jgi:hypothetical protein